MCAAHPIIRGADDSPVTLLLREQIWDEFCSHSWQTLHQDLLGAEDQHSQSPERRRRREDEEERSHQVSVLHPSIIIPKNTIEARSVYCTSQISSDMSEKLYCLAFELILFFLPHWQIFLLVLRRFDYIWLTTFLLFFNILNNFTWTV